MILAVQTNIPGRLSVWLLTTRGLLIKTRHFEIEPGGSDKLLQHIDHIMRQQRMTLQQIKKYVVVRGPGPFTPVRTGIVVMNTLSMISKKPVVGIVSERPCTTAQIMQSVARSKRQKWVPVRPWYGRVPNISQPSLSRVRALRRHVGRGHARTAAK